MLLQLLSSCNLATHKNAVMGTNKIISIETTDSDSLVDYKSNKYKLFIGQSLDSMNKIIELRHDFMTDDGKINDSGITHYMNIGEDLVNIDNTDCLPALFFTIDKEKLIEFKCSILFTPNSFEMESIKKCLKDVEHLFTALQPTENKVTLAKTFSLKIENEKFNELFYLDTVGRKYDILFCYRKETK